ncbi:MAG: hypothetical protein A3J74_02270 [Elusimicrobia bacterium RIFCSPHIGHO2_02_FULL_57_9]|nr:MAG: hypothetical protein A3J74_02270 [Elusimicrobia bacterium RIFCSPHIGHO2_02_FULL_57_9]
MWAQQGHKHEEKTQAAAQPAGEAVTIAGEVLDLYCYLGHGATGREHKKCAKQCLLEKHVSAGLLSADGAVYLLVSDHKHEKAFAAVGRLAAEQVKVTGVKAVKGGLQAILVHKIEKA